MENIDWSKTIDMGLYTVPVAARLLAARQYKVRSWIEGVPNSGAQPILVRQLPRVGGKTLLGFLDVIESAFVRHFLAIGYSPQTIRKVALRLREKHKTEHPFAMNTRFRADGKAIFAEVIDDEGERRIWNVMNEQFEIGEVIEKSLFDQIFYHNDVATEWPPIANRPDVIINPRIAFGRPVIKEFLVPTETLHSAYMADGDAEEVADEYRVTPEAVMTAVGFEQELRDRTLH
jgi:uncharacterized protein (DUF433 family)